MQSAERMGKGFRSVCPEVTAVVSSSKFISVYHVTSGHRLHSFADCFTREHRAHGDRSLRTHTQHLA